MATTRFRAQCDACRRFVSEDAAMKCGRCRFSIYCSKRCQLADWPAHRAQCGRCTATMEAVVNAALAAFERIDVLRNIGDYPGRRRRYLAFLFCFFGSPADAAPYCAAPESIDTAMRSGFATALQHRGLLLNNGHGFMCGIYAKGDPDIPYVGAHARADANDTLYVVVREPDGLSVTETQLMNGVRGVRKSMKPS